MKRKEFIFLLLALCLSVALHAQDSKAEKRVERKIRKQTERARQATADSIAFATAVEALNARQFVLEADQLTFQNGRTTFVSSNTNFVSMNGDSGTVQIAFNTAYSGPNGIGGVTVDGRVSDLKMTTDKRGNVSCSFSIQGSGISAMVFLTLPAGNNNATVSVNPNFNSRDLSLSGKLVPLEESSVFKGRSW